MKKAEMTIQEMVDEILTDPSTIHDIALYQCHQPGVAKNVIYALSERNPKYAIMLANTVITLFHKFND